MSHVKRVGWSVLFIIFKLLQFRWLRTFRCVVSQFLSGWWRLLPQLLHWFLWSKRSCNGIPRRSLATRKNVPRSFGWWAVTHRSPVVYQLDHWLPQLPHELELVSPVSSFIRAIQISTLWRTPIVERAGWFYTAGGWVPQAISAQTPGKVLRTTTLSLQLLTRLDVLFPAMILWLEAAWAEQGCPLIPHRNQVRPA